MSMDEDVLLADYKAARTVLYNSAEWNDASAEEKSDLALKFMFRMIIEHIQDHAQITFRTTDEEIQTSGAPGNPTTGPASDIELDAGQIS